MFTRPWLIASSVGLALRLALGGLCAAANFLLSRQSETTAVMQVAAMMQTLSVALMCVGLLVDIAIGALFAGLAHPEEGLSSEKAALGGAAATAMGRGIMGVISAAQWSTIIASHGEAMVVYAVASILPGLIAFVVGILLSAASSAMVAAMRQRSPASQPG